MSRGGKLIRVAAVIFAVLAVCACGSEALASAQGKRIALLATLNTNPYVGAWTSTFMKHASADGMKVTNLESPYDAALQAQQVDDAIAQKFAMIVIDYINDQAILPALTRAKAAGVPVVLIATPLAQADEGLFLAYIGTDHHELGRIAGENLVKALAAE
ncbi:MAG: sugar ABC transporter substrate-binding protein, partial [Stellaceae bacterium]